MSRKSNTSQRREEIVEALLVVMSKQGYEKATVQAIAKQAELTPGLIHYHFKNKEEILLALVDSIAALSNERYVKFIEPANTPTERIRAYIDARLAKGIGANPKAVAAWVMIGAEAVRQPVVRRAYQEIIRGEILLLQTLIAARLTEQGKPPTLASDFATILIAFMEGAFQLSSTAHDVMPKGYAASAATLMIEQLVRSVPHTNLDLASGGFLAK